MSTLVNKEDWEALIELLHNATKSLTTKQVETVRLNLLEFINAAAMLELKDLSDVGDNFKDFLLKTVAPEWNAEAVATLSFAIGALAEKMQLNEYGAEFSSGLGEILVYLELYESEEPSAAEVPVASAAHDVTLEGAASKIPDPNIMISETDLLAVLAGEVLEDNPSGRAEYQETAEPMAEVVKLTEPVVRSAMGHVFDIIDWYREVLNTDPASEAYCLLAEEFCSRNRWKEAVDTCRQGLGFRPRHLR